MATVFVFTGRAYYGKPGIDWQMTQVQEDYAERRPFKSAWAKAQSWMVANGYRKLWTTPVGRGVFADFQVSNVGYLNWRWPSRSVGVVRSGRW